MAIERDMSDIPESTVEFVETLDLQAIEAEARANSVLSITIERDGERWKITRTVRRVRSVGPGWERGKPPT